MKSTIHEMQVVILCGGQGTRIRDVAEDRPKPMVEIGGKPILWHIMKYFEAFGVRRFVLALGYRGEKIVDYFTNFRLRHYDFTMNTRDGAACVFHDRAESGVEDWEITMVHTGENTMTGGRIKRVAPFLQGERFFVTYGDGLATVNLKTLLEFHQNHGRSSTLTGVHQPTTFGIVEVSKEGRVQSFREKPTLEGYINGGFFVFNREILDEIKGDETVLEEGPLRSMTHKEQLFMFRHDGFWHCMDHYKDYASLNAMWAEGKAPWKVW